MSVSVSVNHLTGKSLFQHSDRLEAYLSKVLSPHVAGRTWMDSTADLARRFQLPKFAEMTEEEAAGYDWDPRAVEGTINAVVEMVSVYIPLEQVEVTVVPALPFRWFREFNLPPSRWSNAFTNGPGNLVPDLPLDHGDFYAGRVDQDGRGS